MTIDMSQFFQVFFDETEELLAEKEKLLLAIDIHAAQKDEIDAIFRTAHSIKGGAATFGLTDITEVTHVLESLLDRIRKGEMALTAEHVDAFLAAKDILMMLVNGHRHGDPVDQAAVDAIRARLGALSAGESMPAAAQTQAPSQPAPTTPPAQVSPPVQHAAPQQAQEGEHIYRIELPKTADKDVQSLETELGLMGKVAREAQADGRVAFRLVTAESKEDILAICSFVLDPDDLKITEANAPAESAQEPAQKTIAEAPSASGVEMIEEGPGYGLFMPLPHAETPAAVPSVGMPPTPAPRDAGAATESKAAAKAQADRSANPESTSIRVSIEKVDQLINLVGELVITQAMIEQRTGTLDPMQHERLLSSVGQLTRNTRDLQEAVMSIRMMPMDYVFSRFPRMVRDLASKLGKKVDFVTHGAATELDKGLIERIIDPLTHLVRNSIDHGIEMPAARLAAGKSEMGKLSLSAAHQGGNIVIEVSDDGGGLNREKILEKAKQQGLPVSDTMTDEEVWHLIFAPGFSTADTVTDISGRGVGMDVVRRNITAMGGVVDIRSAKGFGTTMSISLPLTLAILDGMSIKVGEEVYILPLGYVLESLQPAPADVKDVADQGRVVKVRGDYLPLISLYRMFNIEPRYTDPSEGIVVILEADGKKAALFIDELVGQQQVVVKNLESNYRKVAGISGATILGDGGVALILDVSALLRSSRQLDAQTALY